MPGEYSIAIDFKTGTKNPSRVFHSMSGLIEAFQQIDSVLARVVDTEVKPVLVLERVQTGSIKTVLRTVLESVDDTALKEGDWKKALGAYLIAGKHRILRFLDGGSDGVTPHSIGRLQGDLRSLAAGSELNQLAAYSPVPRERVVLVLANLTSALEPLSGNDSVEFASDIESQEVNTEFRLPEDSLESLTHADVIENRAEMIFQVKKPDFIGNSMWELKHGSRPFFARIEDSDWLGHFQRREVSILPGDAIRAVLHSRVAYDEAGEVIHTRYAILNVIEVIAADRQEQTLLLPRSTEEELDS